MLVVTSCTHFRRPYILCTDKKERVNVQHLHRAFPVQVDLAKMVHRCVRTNLLLAQNPR